jgi:ABC-type transport system substrate-binding protein
MKKEMLVLTSVLITLTLAACSGNKTGSTSAKKDTSQSSSGPSADKYLTVAIGTNDNNPDTFDSQKTTNYYNIPLNIFDRLVECEPDASGETKLVPGLADSWDISPDGKVYTFHLHKGVKFSNGEELKADDVIYTVNRMMDPATNALNTDVFDLIKGAEAMYNGKAKTVSGIKAIDNYTVQMTLEKPFAPFLANLSVPGASIYNRKACEAAGKQFGIAPALTAGTGPFIVKKWTLNSEIVLDRNSDYFKGPAQLDGIRYKVITDANTAKMAFENGEIDVLDLGGSVQSQTSYFKTSDKWKNNIVRGSVAGIYYYLFNESLKPLDNINVRKAIRMAIDRKTILDQLYNGEGTVVDTIVPKGIIGYNKEAPAVPYDPEGAKKLLADAGYANGVDLTIYQQNNNQETLQMNQVVQSMLAQVGIRVKIVQLDKATYDAKRHAGNEITMYRGAWSADYNDPDNFLYTFFSEKNTAARSVNYTNKTVMSDLEKARTMVDQNVRIKLYQKTEQTILTDDAMFFPLFQLNKLFIVSSRVKNFKVAWNGWFDMSYYNVSMQ